MLYCFYEIYTTYIMYYVIYLAHVSIKIIDRVIQHQSRAQPHYPLLINISNTDYLELHDVYLLKSL